MDQHILDTGSAISTTSKGKPRYILCRIWHRVQTHNLNWNRCRGCCPSEHPNSPDFTTGAGVGSVPPGAGSWANHHGDNHGLRSFDRSIPVMKFNIKSIKTTQDSRSFQSCKKIREDSCVLCVLCVLLTFGTCSQPLVMYSMWLHQDVLKPATRKLSKTADVLNALSRWAQLWKTKGRNMEKLSKNLPASDR